MLLELSKMTVLNGYKERVMANTSFVLKNNFILRKKETNTKP